jgi:hypothetical protein
LQTHGAAVAELEEIAECYGTAALSAAAEHTRGALELASGNADEAVAHLVSGQRLWLRVEPPGHPSSRTRTKSDCGHFIRAACLAGCR